MRVKFFLLLLLLALPARAYRISFNFLKFHCARADGPLVSEIHFYQNLQRQLTGELDFYSVFEGTKTFLSGEMLLLPEYRDGIISGTTQEPGTLAETFILLREETVNSGRWYFNSNISGKSNLQGEFVCQLERD